MPMVHKSVKLPYSVQQMFDLVNDINSYPQFVPACESSKILVQTEDEIRASLTFYKNGLRKSFETLNRLLPYKMIEIRLIHGPFKRLEGFWSFESIGDNEKNVNQTAYVGQKNQLVNEIAEPKSCKVTFNLEFEFSSSILKLMFGPIFHQITVMLVDAFQERAHHVYGGQI